LSLPNSPYDDIVNEIEAFWKKRDVFLKNGFVFKRGYLLWGPQGGGKSATVARVSQNVISKGGVVFLCDKPKVLIDAISIYRKVQPITPIVCLFEDIDSTIKEYGDRALLTLLDGE